MESSLQILEKYERRESLVAVKSKKQKALDEIKTQTREIKRLATALISSFKTLFSEASSAYDLDREYKTEISLDEEFNVGSKLVKVDQIAEKEKARFLVSLLHHYNLAKKRLVKMQDFRLEQLRAKQEEEAKRKYEE